MIELRNDELCIGFPEVHPNAHCRIQFQRTLRIPDDNRPYPLPPGLGRFPLFHIDDYAAQVPVDWRAHGGVFMPMYQAEALWIYFSADYPFALKIAAGKVNAVTGGAWDNQLHAQPQDYLVVPDQPWLDGFCVAKGLIRQFVAMPLGEGYTAEEQLTGEARHGGLQIIAYPMKAGRYRSWRESLRHIVYASICDSSPMGLAPGGLMRQHIYEDEHGLDAWDTALASRCFVHILNSNQFLSVTGCRPPTGPVTAKQYTAAGLPWFDYYDADRKALDGAGKLAGLDSVAAKKLKKGEGLLAENDPIQPAEVVQLGNGRPRVREGSF